jgi:hypothetical protein
MSKVKYRKNTFALTAKPIPYYKEYRKIAGSVTATILWQQLEYWFSLKEGKSFYKSLEEWEGELGFSACEFRLAFSKIGISYASKKLFDTEKDVFKGKMYASFHNKMEHKVYYVRNQEMVENNLKTLTYPSSVNKETSSTGDKETSSTEIRKPNVELTESTTETTTENTLQTAVCEEKFSSDEYITNLISTGTYPIKIIGWYFKVKGLSFPTKVAGDTELKRWLRDANILKDYPQQKIGEVYKLVSEKFPFDWKLSTIVKYINETKSDEQILIECIEEAKSALGMDGDWEARARRSYLRIKEIPFENHWANPVWTKWLKKYPYLKT